MNMDGWTETTSQQRSDDLPRYLRLSRLMGLLATWTYQERIDAATMAADLQAVVDFTVRDVPLPGTPVQLRRERGGQP